MNQNIDCCKLFLCCIILVAGCGDSRPSDTPPAAPLDAKGNASKLGVHLSLEVIWFGGLAGTIRGRYGVTTDMSQLGPQQVYLEPTDASKVARIVATYRPYEWTTKANPGYPDARQIGLRGHLGDHKIEVIVFMPPEQDSNMGKLLSMSTDIEHAIGKPLVPNEWLRR